MAVRFPREFLPNRSLKFGARGSNLQISFTTAADTRYAVEWSASLPAVQWNAVAVAGSSDVAAREMCHRLLTRARDALPHASTGFGSSESPHNCSFIAGGFVFSGALYEQDALLFAAKAPRVVGMGKIWPRILLLRKNVRIELIASWVRPDKNLA